MIFEFKCSYIYMLNPHALQASRALMSAVRESINNFIELAKEEADLGLAVEWEKVEKERTKMRNECRKVKKALRDCQDKLAAQEKLTGTA